MLKRFLFFYSPVSNIVPLCAGVAFLHCDKLFERIKSTFKSSTDYWDVKQGFLIKFHSYMDEVNEEIRFGDRVLFFSTEAKSKGLRVADAAYILKETWEELSSLEPSQKFKTMKPATSLTCVQNDLALEMFTADGCVRLDNDNIGWTLIDCIVRLTSTIDSFQFQFRDSLFPNQLWSSAVDKKLTDLELKVGDRIFHVHRSLLAIRCPALLADTPSGRVEKVDDPAVFEEFLHFLYTGKLKSTAVPRPELFQAAELYNVKTLKLIGQAQRRFGGQMDRNKLSETLMLFCN